MNSFFWGLCKSLGATVFLINLFISIIRIFTAIIIWLQVVPGPEGGEEDDLLDAGLPRHQHRQPVHAQPEPRRRRQAVLQDAREGLVVLGGGRQVALAVKLLGVNSTENWIEGSNMYPSV